MKISILLPKGELAIAPIATMRAMFLEANDFLKNQGKAVDLFEVELVASGKKSLRAEAQFSIRPEKTLTEVGQIDLIILPPIFGNPAFFIKQNKRVIDWFSKKYKDENIEIATLCKGVFLLAASKILDGKTATTHWAEAERFRKMFPEVKLLPEKIITDEQGIYTSGGAFSAFNLILYLIEKFGGKEVAVFISKLFAISYDRNSQAPFMIFQNQKKHGDTRIEEVQNFMEKNFQKTMTIHFLAQKFAFSNRNFIRRFQAATGNTPIQYLQRIRIEYAKRKLENSEQPISEIIYESGYNDFKTFRETFKKYVGATPKSYRDKYKSFNAR